MENNLDKLVELVKLILKDRPSFTGNIKVNFYGGKAMDVETFERTKIA